MRIRRFQALSAAVVFLLLQISLSGQSTNEAALRGTVSDPSGAVLPGATVTLINVLTNISQVAHTDERGTYTFRALPASTFKMLTVMRGFGTIQQDNIILTVNQQATLNVTMSPAAETTSVTVHAIPVLLDSEDATLGTDVDSKYIVQIPLNDRDSFGLTFLAGGVTEVTGQGTQDSYPAGTNFVSNGQRNATADIRLDGNLTSAPEQAKAVRQVSTMSLQSKRFRSSRSKITVSQPSTATMAAPL